MSDNLAGPLLEPFEFQPIEGAFLEYDPDRGEAFYEDVPRYAQLEAWRDQFGAFTVNVLNFHLRKAYLLAVAHCAAARQMFGDDVPFDSDWYADAGHQLAWQHLDAVSQAQHPDEEPYYPGMSEPDADLSGAPCEVAA